MAGPTEQQTIETVGVQPTHPPSFWGVIDKIVTEWLSTDIPLSVFLLLVVALVGPILARWWWVWKFGPGKKSSGDET